MTLSFYFIKTQENLFLAHLAFRPCELLSSLFVRRPSSVRQHSSWLEVGITGHKFGKGPSKDHSIKVWLQLAQWFLRRRLKCESIKWKFSTKKGAYQPMNMNPYLGFGKACHHCWMKTLISFCWVFGFFLYLFCVCIVVILDCFSHCTLVIQKTIISRTIPLKFGCNWPSGFWGED
jgi:hypothetical protein